MLPPFVGLKGNNQPGAALQDSSEQACPRGELDRDGPAIGRCRCAASDGRTLSTPSRHERASQERRSARSTTASRREAAKVRPHLTADPVSCHLAVRLHCVDGASVLRSREHPLAVVDELVPARYPAHRAPNIGHEPRCDVFAGGGTVVDHLLP
jgi:hypothetical protein